MVREKSDLNIGVIFTMIVASALLLLVVIVAAQAMILYEEREEVDAKWDESRNATLTDLLKDQKARLNGPARTMSPATRPSSIPIGQAMGIVVQNKGHIVFPAGK
ncbi:MAG: hypothetical protein ABSH20_10185 [Tepidisphaeraceae bacterium]|jgi:hypothetical protein